MPACTRWPSRPSASQVEFVGGLWGRLLRSSVLGFRPRRLLGSYTRLLKKTPPVPDELVVDGQVMHHPLDIVDSKA
eukprot:4001247-Pyramimonas_sp.AAC.1